MLQLGLSSYTPILRWLSKTASNSQQNVSNFDAKQNLTFMMAFRLNLFKSHLARRKQILFFNHRNQSQSEFF